MAKISDIANSIELSGLQKLLNIHNIEDYISLGLGLPSPDFFPKNLNIDSINMQYAPPMEKLKSQIRDIAALRGIDCGKNEIFVTSGAQQAIALLLSLLCDAGDIVLCEELTYYGFVQAAKMAGAKVETIYQDTFSGINPAQLEDKIKSLPKKPKLIYLIPTGHNPISVSLTKEHKTALANIANKYGIPIIEDDAYGFLNYHHPDGCAIHPLRVTNSQNIFYISSFSKILAPSLRVGYMIAPEQYHEKLSILKEASDLNVTSFSMGLVSKFLEENSFKDHITNITKEYKTKRDIMAKSIDEHLSDYVTYQIPDAGMYFWLETVDDIDSMELYRRAIDEKLLIMPGSAFAVTDSLMGRNGIRLNFTHPSKEDIVEGVKRLGVVINEG